MAGHDEVQLQALFADGDRQYIPKLFGNPCIQTLNVGYDMFIFVCCYFVCIDSIFISQYFRFSEFG